MITTAAITQSKRLLSVTSPLGKDVLLVEACSGAEGISRLFSYRVEMLVDRQQSSKSLTGADLLGKKIAVALEVAGGHRFFHGIVKEFTQLHRDTRFVHYEATVVPWMWLLTQKANCRIFQNLNTPEIVKKIFDDLKKDFPDLVSYRDGTSKTYTKSDYRVQYRETDFNFVSRLMEEDGIFYFFEHEKDKHTLVMADSSSAFQPNPINRTVRFEPEGGFGEREDTISSFVLQHEFSTGQFRLRDFHFETPSKDLERSETTCSKVNGNEHLEVYDFPGDYAKRFNAPGQRLANVQPLGEELVRVRMEEDESGRELFIGNSVCRGLVTGTTFDLTNHYGFNGKYVIVSAEHELIQTPHYVSDDVPTIPYRNKFTCIRQAVPFRPPRLATKPIVQGPQTATVTVKQGEDSWLDKYGRVRVQFPWDREGKNDENSTCWLRVAQPWAGALWGAHFWPRVGQEVVVDFLEGDPDRPIVTGSVYNSAQMPPYELPRYYTRSGIKTRSSKNGGSANWNEIRFEDKKGAEQVFLNAERDMDTRVEHDSREYIGNNRHLVVHANQHELVEADKHTQIKGNEYKKVEKDTSFDVGSDRMERVGSDMSVKVGRNQMQNIGSDQSLTVGSNCMQKVGGNMSLNVGSDCKQKIGSNLSIKVGQACEEKVGTKFAVDAGQEIHLKAGVNVVIEAGVQLSLKAAGGFIDIGPAGVSIQGAMVLINSGGAPGAGTGASPGAPDPPNAPNPPVAPQAPETADDGSKGGKL